MVPASPFIDGKLPKEVYREQNLPGLACGARVTAMGFFPARGEAQANTAGSTCENLVRAGEKTVLTQQH